MDLVCGMKLDPAAKNEHAEFAGLGYDFCSRLCRDRFLDDPVRFAAVTVPPAPPHVHRGVTYVCPMHSTIVRDTPICPTCNTALEPSVRMP